MSRRLFLFFLLTLTFATQDIYAQDLVVSYAAGKIQAEVDGKTTDLHINSKLRLSTIVNIPYEGKLELLDEKEKKRYSIVKPGKSTVREHIAATGNSTVTITARYLAYIKSQIGNSDKSEKIQRAHVYTDYATVTREILAYEEEENRQNIEEEIKKLSPRERILAKRAINHKRHDAFRDSVIQRHLDFVRKAWEGRDVHAAVDKPLFKEIGPKTVDPSEKSTDRLKIADWFKSVLSSSKDRNKIITPDDIANQSHPEPLFDIEETQPIIPSEEIYFPFEYFGTEMKVRIDERGRVNIGKLSPNRVADVLARFSGGIYNNLLYDCIQLRNTHNLNDWAYFEMLQTICNDFCGIDSNEATLLVGFLAYQSGYSIRFATDTSKKRLYLLMQSKHVIYGHPFYEGKNPDEKFYIFGADIPSNILMCGAEFPKEQGLSFFINSPMLLDENPTPVREIQGYRIKENSISVSTNQNLIKFYDTYPASEVNSNVCTRWAMYANTPMNPEICKNLYPKLQQLIEGKDVVEQVYTLMDLIHGIPYEYDTQVWGHDRTFFAEETLHYPGCDCEDRSILLTRWVRDLIGLPCALVYYPGHLATAIHFDTDVQGDQFEVDGISYTVCDPTYLGSYVGMQMPNMETDKAQIILLNN